MNLISATQLYDFVQCPHRVSLDVFGDQRKRDEPNAFVELLWDQGLEHELATLTKLAAPTNLRTIEDAAARERATLEAMLRGDPLIYGGRLVVDDLVGEPDLLEIRNGRYIPGDIKSGSGFDGDEDDAKLKRHYAYQLAHYVHILERLGRSDGSHEAFVIDRTGGRVPYALDEPQGIRNLESWWNAYLVALAAVRSLTTQPASSLAALSASCKLCHWYSHCKDQLIDADDLTLVAELGRSKRDSLSSELPNVQALADCDPSVYIDKKKTRFTGIGPDSLVKFHLRAKLLKTKDAKPYLKAKVNLPVSRREVFFDIEADPMRDVVYLHGFIEREHGQPETAQFIAFFAEGIKPSDEALAFGSAWDFLKERVKYSTVYYYSKYERTAYRKLADKYPEVCARSDVDELFSQSAMIDLYEVVRSSTEWPTYDQSIKTLAQFANFRWRDTHPSGAASIEWFHRYIEQNDAAVKKRILDYNEDDCLATGVVVDAIRRMPECGV